MPEKPVLHGQDHRAGGIDPITPGYWHYVHSSTFGVPAAWNSGTNYVPGNTVSHDVYIYMCMQANTNVEPNVNTNWAVYWIIDVPIFQNGWGNAGGSLQPMRYRLSVGRPHVLNYNNGSITDYSDHQIEIEGSATGGSFSTIMFYLPTNMWPENEVRRPASDDVGGFVPYQIEPNGAVYKGLH